MSISLQQILKFKYPLGLFEYPFVNSEKIIRWSLIMKQFILIKEVTTYLMKAGGGLSAPLLPHPNAGSLCFWESNWKVFSGYICARKDKRNYAYQTNACHFKRVIIFWCTVSSLIWRRYILLVQIKFLSYFNTTDKIRNIFNPFDQLSPELSRYVYLLMPAEMLFFCKSSQGIHRTKKKFQHSFKHLFKPLFIFHLLYKIK